ncbi:UNVERIFIED_CONTAM: Xaa-Pro dipeptidase [Brevibacillus sp. OAP136]
MDQQKLQTLHTYMNEQGLDAMLLTTPKHVYYLTGFLSDPHERFLGLVIPKQGEAVLIVPALDLEAAQQSSSVKTIATHTDTQNPYEVLQAHLPAGIKRLGLEKGDLTVSRFEALAAVIQAADYVDVDVPIRQMRMVKSADEVSRIKKALQITEDALAAVVGQVKVGMTELDVVAELEYQMKKLGSEGLAFPTMVLAGEKSAMPHGAPGNRTIQAGELLLFDLGVAYDGYYSDITRTFAVGEVGAKEQEIYQTVLAANLAGIGATKAGVTLASIDRAARDVIAAKGYGDYFIHRLGHGLGMDCHEYPSVHGENQDLLQTGMVFTIEPGIYVPGIAGVRIEDDVWVTENGCEVLSRFPKELQVIGV